MPDNRWRALAGLTAAFLIPAHAVAQTPDGSFRGSYVCEKLPLTRDMLRVPIDLVVRGDRVQFARPLLTLNGRRVRGSELAAGTIDARGRLHVTSAWTYLGNTAAGDYSGTLTPSGGTLSGTQTWTGPGGGPPVVRACTLALVPAPTFAATAPPR